MASFNKHLVSAMLVSGLVSVILFVSKVSSSQAVIQYFFLGTIGGLLPDIDAHTSIAVRIISLGLSIFLGFLVLFKFGHLFSLLVILLLLVCCFVFVRLLFNLIAIITTHRGLIHTVPFGVLCGATVTTIAYHYYSTTVIHAWMCGLFVTIGFITHLLLDEMHSITLINNKTYIKNSFGTAFSFWRVDHPIGTITLYLCMLLTLYFGPPAQPFIDFIFRLKTSLTQCFLLPTEFF